MRYRGFWRWFVGFEVEGELELLSYWPADFAGEPAGEDEYHVPAPDTWWQPTTDGVLAFFDVPPEDDPEGMTPPVDRYVAAATYLDTAMDAVNRELARREAQLRAELVRQLQRRRSRLNAIAGHNRGLVELLRLDPGPIELAEAVPERTAPRVIDREGQEVALTLVVGRKSFADFVTATVKWRSGVERYPDAYRGLDENGLTSLLVTTLNVVFDCAQREVYHGKGRTDFLVEASLGRPEHSAFIGEAKVWAGARQVRRHLLQLLGYGIGSTTELMLLYCVRNRRISVIRTACRRSLEGNCADLLIRSELGQPGTETVAVVRHPEYGHTVAVTIVFVHVPTAPAADGGQAISPASDLGSQP